MVKKISIINSVSCMNRAGQETLLMNILRNIDKDKFQFDFLCSVHQKGDYDDEIHELGGRIFYLPPSKLTGIKFFSYIGTILSVYSFLRKNKEYQEFHIHNYHAFSSFLEIVGAKMAGVKKVLLHSHNTSAPHIRLHYVFRSLLNLVSFQRLACSRAAAVWMYGAKADKAVVIKNGIILDEFKYREEWRKNKRKELGIADDVFLVGHVGRFNYQKNHMFLLDIFAEIHQKNKKSVLMLVGKGELFDDVKNKIHDLNLDEAVILAGVRSDVNELLSCFDVMLFPSLFEGLSVTLVEAQAAGLPCVVSDTNSPEVILTECVHFVSLKKSASEWADITISMANNGRLDTTIALQQHGYDIKQSVKKLESIYADLKE